MPDIFSAHQHADQSVSEKEAAEGEQPLVATDPTVSDVNEALEAQVEETRVARPRRHVDEYSLVMRQEEPSSNPLHAFAPKPADVYFDSQLHNEKVILLLRRHPITQVPWVVIAILLVFLPFFLRFAFPFFSLLPSQYQFAFSLGWYALVFSFILESFLMWFFNVYIISDERVIDVDFHSLIYKNISAAKLDNIEDISATTGGAIRSIFDYGTIRIQTAATKAEFEFEDVPHPAKVTSLLNELLQEEELEKIEGRVN